MRILAGYHPLLLLFEKERGGRKVVPLDLELGDSAGVTTLLVTGPNTGGKTIAIKGAGLLTMMAQSGIPVPVDPASIFPAGAVIAADIGDDQSLEESLSTFSAHIGKIASIIAKADHKTLVLLDELGTGTDPVQGGAIACAVLAELQSKGCLVLATTHLIDIVAFVQKSAGMVNGAMEFDRKSLTPSYRLTVGEPGQSHAIDTARRCGLPERVLIAAEAMVGKMESEFHGLLAELRRAKNEAEELARQTAQRERAAAALEKQLETRLRDLEQKKHEEREKRLLAEKELLTTAKREINGILSEARTVGGGKKALQEIAAKEAAVEQELEIFRPGRQLDFDKLTPGAMVYLKPLGRDACVVSIDMKQRRARVRAGSLETELPFDAIEGATGEKPRPQPAKRTGASEDSGRYELNLIGLRVEEALLEMEKFLDSSLLTGKREVRIIHGIGTGALMRGIREHLARSPHVEAFRKGEGFEGGDGATVVTLNG
jgi:DNA mismatch repair protein MutS2